MYMFTHAYVYIYSVSLIHTCINTSYIPTCIHMSISCLVLAIEVIGERVRVCVVVCVAERVVVRVAVCVAACIYLLRRVGR